MNPPEDNDIAEPGSVEPAGLPAPEPRRRSAALPLILVTALLSAALSAGGTYVAFSLQPRATSPAAVSAAPGALAQVVNLTQSEAIVRVAQLAKPSVVTITTSGLSGISPFSVPTTGAGSGFIVSADGLILTNYHVIMDSASLTVTLDDGRELKAQVVKTDTAHDLAVVRVNATGLTPLSIGDSDAVQVGQLAIAIGSPLGTFTDSVTQGIVSGLDRSITVGERGSRFTESLSGLIQTDAAINPGNSGGPLLDAAGNVIGLITASASTAQDMGFAVPINQAKSILAAASKA